MAFHYHKKQLETQESMELTRSELELILKLLAQTTFPVKDIEVLYIAIFKLQEQYKNANKG